MFSVNKLRGSQKLLNFLRKYSMHRISSLVARVTILVLTFMICGLFFLQLDFLTKGNTFHLT